MSNIQKYMRRGELQKVSIEVPKGMLNAIESFRSNMLEKKSIEMSRSAAFRHLIASSPIWDDVDDHKVGEAMKTKDYLNRFGKS